MAFFCTGGSQHNANIFQHIAKRHIIAKAWVCFCDFYAKGTKTEVSEAVGKAIAAKALAAGIENVVFDRNGFVYHGRIKALADGAREGGLKF